MAEAAQDERLPRWVTPLIIGLLLSAIVAGSSSIVTVAVLSSRVSALEDWREGNFFNAPRYTPTDAERAERITMERIRTERENRIASANRLLGKITELEYEIVICRDKREAHDKEAAKWINTIERHSVDIKENQRKAHEHLPRWSETPNQ